MCLHIASKNQQVGVAGYVGRCHRHAFAAILSNGFDASQTTSVSALSEPSVVDCQQGVAIHCAVLAAAIDAFHESGVVVDVNGMHHVGVIVWREIFFRRVVPIGVVHHRAVEDETRVAVNASETLAVGTLPDRTSSTACKHLRHQGSATDVYESGAVCRG